MSNAKHDTGIWISYYQTKCQKNDLGKLTSLMDRFEHINKIFLRTFNCSGYLANPCINKIHVDIDEERKKK